MNRATCLVLLALGAATAACVLVAIQVDLMSSSRVLAGQPAAESKGPPRLSLEGLMDEKLSDEAALPTKGETTADNTACYVCHGPFDGEELVAQHVVEGIGCVKCHGSSDAHRNDEDNITPPDTMFAREDIDRECKACHETHDAAAEKVVARFIERCKNVQNADDLACTDCHGHHKLPFRNVEWNKKTRELINK